MINHSKEWVRQTPLGKVTTNTVEFPQRYQEKGALHKFVDGAILFGAVPP